MAFTAVASLRHRRVPQMTGKRVNLSTAFRAVVSLRLDLRLGPRPPHRALHDLQRCGLIATYATDAAGGRQPVSPRPSGPWPHCGAAEYRPNDQGVTASPRPSGPWPHCGQRIDLAAITMSNSPRPSGPWPHCDLYQRRLLLSQIRVLHGFQGRGLIATSRPRTKAAPPRSLHGLQGHGLIATRSPCPRHRPPPSSPRLSGPWPHCDHGRPLTYCTYASVLHGLQGRGLIATSAGTARTARCASLRGFQGRGLIATRCGPSRPSGTSSLHGFQGRGLIATLRIPDTRTPNARSPRPSGLGLIATTRS